MIINFSIWQYSTISDKLLNNIYFLYKSGEGGVMQRNLSKLKNDYNVLTSLIVKSYIVHVLPNGVWYMHHDFIIILKNMKFKI